MEPSLLLKASILHLKDEPSRELSLQLLAVLGLYRYFELTDDVVVDLDALKGIYDKTNIAFNNLLSRRQPPTLPSKSKTPASTTTNTTSSTRPKEPRISRSDAMAHFPFTDAYGTVFDVFHDNASEDQVNNILGSTTVNNINNSKFLQMGEPARVRLAKKTFAEFKIGNSGMAIKDIPDAIRALGLPVTHILEKGCKQFNAKQSAASGDRGTVGGKKKLVKDVLLIDQTINLEQWLNLVKRYTTKRAYINSLESDNERSSNNISNDVDVEMDSNEEGENPYQNLDFENVDLNFGEPFRASRTAPAKLASSSSSSRTASAAASTKPSSSKGKVDVVGAKSQEYLSKIRNVKSSLGSQIREDRYTYNKNSEFIKDSAMSSIARRRVQQLVEKPLPFTSESDDEERIEEARRAKAKYNRLRDLGSGAAAMMICDSFLESQIGKEMAGHLNQFSRKDIGASQAYTMGSDFEFDLDDSRDIDAMYAAYRKPSNAPSKLNWDNSEIEENVAKEELNFLIPSMAKRNEDIEVLVPPETKVKDSNNNKNLTGADIENKAYLTSKVSKSGWAADFGHADNKKVSSSSSSSSRRPERFISTKELGVKPWNRVKTSTSVSASMDSSSTAPIAKNVTSVTSSRLGSSVSRSIDANIVDSAFETQSMDQDIRIRDIDSLLAESDVRVTRSADLSNSSGIIYDDDDDDDGSSSSDGSVRRMRQGSDSSIEGEDDEGEEELVGGLQSSVALKDVV